MDALINDVKEKKPKRRVMKVMLPPEPAMPVEAVRPKEPERPAEVPKPKEVEKPVEKQEPRIIREYYTTIREVPKVITKTKVVRRKPAVKRKARKPKK